MSKPKIRSRNLRKSWQRARNKHLIVPIKVQPIVTQQKTSANTTKNSNLEELARNGFIVLTKGHYETGLNTKIDKINSDSLEM
jgi:hypothetical protein